MKKNIDVFLICPVRGIHGRVEAAIKRYVSELEEQGLVVYWPQRDTMQVDPSGGVRICRDNIKGMIEAEQIHIWWNRESIGSKFDMGASMAMAMLLYYEGTGKEKKFVIANPDNIRKPTEGKSFENVFLQLSRDDIWDVFDELDELYDPEDPNATYKKLCEDLETADVI